VRAGLAGALSLLVLAASGCGGETTGLPGSRTAVARTSIVPSVHLFAEPVVAYLDVTVDPQKVDPDRIRVTSDFRPYEVVRVEKTREGLDGLTRLLYAFTLRCLVVECIPRVLPSAAGEAESGRGDRMTFSFGRGRVLEREGTAEPRVIASARWPTLESISRINTSSVPRGDFVFKTSVTPLPPATFRVSPTLLAALLLAAAAALLAFPMTLAVVGWRRRRPPAVVQESADVPPVERALRLVEWASTNGDAAFVREALELLAWELDASRGTSLARDARRLAWSAGPPANEEAVGLVTSVREASLDAA
jgi:hypothetical protein